MTDSEVINLTIAELAPKIEAREISPVEVTLGYAVTPGPHEPAGLPLQDVPQVYVAQADGGLTAPG